MEKNDKLPSSLIQGNTNFLEEFRQSVRNSVIKIFSLSTRKQKIPLNTFLKNSDHGTLHSFSVHKKANEIADRIEQETGEIVDREMLYFMAITHDSGRFHTSKNEKKQLHCERSHNKCGMAQVQKGIRNLRIQNFSINQEQEEDIMDYVYNHDFFNARLDGNKYKEPQSLEGQIVRLADRMSTDISTEVRRYWKTGKRLETPYFKREVSFEDRVVFSFPKIKDYIKSGKFDEFTFFLTLLSMSSEDFSHPIMKNIYNEWAKNKDTAITTILKIAQEEGFSEEEIQEMKKLVDQYILHFNLVW